MIYRKSVSIVIPNFNGVSLLKQYLPDTIQAIEFAQVPYELIIVDDCSTDDSVQFLEKNYPEVRLKVNASNKGFSFTCNQGIAMAKMDLVLLLNSDVSLTIDFFERQLKYFVDPKTFGVMSRIMNKNGKVEDAARKMSFSGFKVKLSEFFINTEPEKQTPTAYLSGANALVSRVKLQELGGFDEIFSPFYCEDVDLSFRAWRVGWKCFYEHESICYHEVSTTTRKEHSKKTLQTAVYKNKFVLHSIHLDGVELTLWYFQLILVEVLLRLLVGKFWILNSFRQYYNCKGEIRISKMKLRELMAEHGSRASLRDVKKKYFDPVKKGGVLSTTLL